MIEPDDLMKNRVRKKVLHFFEKNGWDDGLIYDWGMWQSEVLPLVAVDIHLNVKDGRSGENTRFGFMYDIKDKQLRPVWPSWLKERFYFENQWTKSRYSPYNKTKNRSVKSDPEQGVA